MYQLQDTGTGSGSDDEADQQEDDIDNVAPTSNVSQLKGKISCFFHISSFLKIQVGKRMKIFLSQ